MANYIVQFHLKTEPYQEDALNKRFEIGRQIYNALVNVTQKRYKETVKIRRYRNLISSLSHDKAKDKDIYKQINAIRKEHGLSEYSFHRDVKPMQKHFKENIDSCTAQKIATELWNSYDKLFYGNGESVHSKRYGTFNCLEGKSNKSGIRYKNGIIFWNGLQMPMEIDNNNLYEMQALQNDVAYCRIIRKYVRNKNKYYVQLVFRGKPPVKVNIDTGEVKHPIGNGDVGLDIGTSTIAVASESDVKIYELADKIQKIEDKRRRLLRKMDRSKRAMNPQNYNPDGTIKCQGSKKVIWNKSNHYIQYQNKLKELYRKQKDVRKYQHECLANYILSLGDKVYVERMNFKGLQKRSAKTEKNSKGRYKCKKRYGKSLANRAPAMLLSIIDRKLSYFDKQLIQINTAKVKASQYNHFDGSYHKKSRSQRWNNFDGVKIQRDMYSAFLIMNINNDLETINTEKCNQRFNNFKRLHDIEVARLTGKHNLSCVGI